MKNLPRPNEPFHVDNINSIDLLESQGFEGPDATLSISLFEYGFAWKELPEPDKDGDNLILIYGIKVNNSGEYIKFDRCGMKSATDAVKEWDWAFNDSHGFLSAYGRTLEEFQEMPFKHQVYDLFSYFGSEEIFGTAYYGGFSITE